MVWVEESVLLAEGVELGPVWTRTEPVSFVKSTLPARLDPVIMTTSDTHVDSIQQSCRFQKTMLHSSQIPVRSVVVLWILHFERQSQHSEPFA